MTKFIVRHSLSLGLCLFIGLAAWIIAWPHLRPGEAEGYLRYFTQCSNLMNGLIALAVAVGEVFCLARRRELPRALTVLQAVGTAAVTLTFLTVVFFLGPVSCSGGRGYFWLFKGDSFWYHFLLPVLSLAAFLGLNRGPALRKRDLLFAMLPMLVYGAVYVYQVLMVYRWPDFYGFTFGYRPAAPFISLPAMVLAAALIAGLLRFLHARLSRPSKGENP